MECADHVRHGSRVVGAARGAKHRQWSPLYRCICDRKAVRSPFTKVKVLTTQLPDRAKSYTDSHLLRIHGNDQNFQSSHAAQSQHPRVAIPPREDGAIIDAYARACIGGGDLQASHVVCLSCSTVTGVCSASSVVVHQHPPYCHPIDPTCSRLHPRPKPRCALSPPRRARCVQGISDCRDRPRRAAPTGWSLDPEGRRNL